MDRHLEDVSLPLPIRHFKRHGQLRLTMNFLGAGNPTDRGEPPSIPPKTLSFAHPEYESAYLAEAERLAKAAWQTDWNARGQLIRCFGNRNNESYQDLRSRVKNDRKHSEYLKRVARGDAGIPNVPGNLLIDIGDKNPVKDFRTLLANPKPEEVAKALASFKDDLKKGWEEMRALSRLHALCDPPTDAKGDIRHKPSVYILPEHTDSPDYVGRDIIRVPFDALDHLFEYGRGPKKYDVERKDGSGNLQKGRLGLYWSGPYRGRYKRISYLCVCYRALTGYDNEKNPIYTTTLLVAVPGWLIQAAMQTRMFASYYNGDLPKVYRR